MADFTDALGLEALSGASTGDFSPGGSLNVPVGPAADTVVPTSPPSSVAASPSPLAPAAGGIDLQQILGMLRPQQPQGALSPNSQFMAALGAGLSSAGQNWNKPALAAFASGAGAALQGGQQWSNQQQDARLKALQAAIAAWKVGDLSAYRQAVVDLRAATARAAARPAASRSPSAPATPPPADATAPVGAANPVPPVAPRAELERLLADAGVPADRAEPADLDGAANLMAARALPAGEAFELASLHNALNAGHVSPAEVDLIYGPGAADAIFRTAAS